MPAAVSLPHPTAGSAKPLTHQVDLDNVEFSQFGMNAQLHRECTGARTDIGDMKPDNTLRGVPSVNGTRYTEADMPRDVPIYAIDPLVRRSRPLQRTRDARKAADL